MKIFWIVVIFLVIGAWIIIKANNYQPTKDFDDTKGFIVDFAKWLFQVGKSTKSTVSYAADQQWLPVINETNQSMVNETNETINITE